MNSVVDWKIFLPLVNRAFYKARKSSAGRKPFNRLMMFKVLLLQGLYSLSDAQTEYQIKDRLSFMRFLGLSLGDAIPELEVQVTNLVLRAIMSISAGLVPLSTAVM